jgi:hypothetical protein
LLGELLGDGGLGPCCGGDLMGGDDRGNGSHPTASR